jgi:hypothetical protein
MIKYEFRRAFGKAFIISVAIGILSGIGGLISYRLDSQWFEPQAVSSYEAWLYCLGVSEASLYKAIFPILICLPYLPTLFSDRKSSFIYKVTTRMPYGKYIRIKYGVGILSAMGVILSTLLFWFISCVLIYPSNPPITIVNYMPMGAFAELYSSNTLGYICLIFTINMLTAAIAFVFCGAVALNCNKRIAVIIAPFAIYLILAILSGFSSFQILNPMPLLFPFESADSTAQGIAIKMLVTLVIGTFVSTAVYFRENREIL